MVKKLLLPLYAVATLFPRFPALPDPLSRVALTELLFPLLLWVFRRELVSAARRVPWFTAALTLYIFGNILAAIWAPNTGAGVEALARLYLAVLAIITVAYVAHYGPEHLIRWWTTAAVVTAGASILYYALVAGGMPDHYYGTGLIHDYPYVGELLRLRGSGQVYGMFFMLLLPAWVFLYADRGKQRRYTVALVVISAAMLLTFSKELLLLPVAALLLEDRLSIAWRVTGTVATIALLMFGTHFLYVPDGFDATSTEATSGITYDLPGPGQLAETNYTANKRAALVVWRAHPLFGVGAGRFGTATAPLVAEGQYPAHFSRFDPHSAWTGALAETGLLGLIGLLALTLSLMYYRPETMSAAAVVLLLFLIASVFKDVMNYRALWLIIGVFLYCPPKFD